MEYITLKNSDLKVSRLCMGGCPMGGYGWGDVQDRELIDAIHVALENGITFFDNADTYGLGHSEEILGRGLENNRKNVVIATKFGVRVTDHGTIYDNRPEYIHKALTASLKRLGTDYIDLYQIHYRDGQTPISEVIEALEEEKKKGRIRYYGLSNIGQSDLEELAPYKGKFVSFQEEYSLAQRKNEINILKLSQKLDMSILTWGSLGQGILTGKYDRNVHFKNNDRRSRAVYVNFHGEKLLKNLAIVEKMKKIALKYQKSVAAVAIRFILDYLPESIALVGAKRPSQIEGNLEGVDWKLEKEDLLMLEEISR